MKVKFKINKLGPITNSEIEINQLMLFSGESGLGKSYTAFLVYYFYKNLYHPESKSNGRKKDSRYAHKFKEARDNGKTTFVVDKEQITEDLNQGLRDFIGYLVGNKGVVCDVRMEIDWPEHDFVIRLFTGQKDKNGAISTFNAQIESDPDFGTALDSLAYNTSDENVDSLIKGLFLTEVVRFLSRSQYRSDEVYSMLLPPARGGLIGASFSTLNTVYSSAGMYEEFIDSLEKIKVPSYSGSLLEVHNDLRELLSDLIKGKITLKEDRLHYDMEGEMQNLPLTAAASSIKELAPLYLLLDKYEPAGLSVLFEEPEAHLHPALHLKVAKLISHLINKGAAFQITTHSDYFLGQISNLIKLHYIKGKMSDEAFTDFCNKHGLQPSLALSSDLVNAYYFKRREDGSVHIVKQNVVKGVPFDTFQATVSNSMAQYLAIDDLIESMENHEE